MGVSSSRVTRTLQGRAPYTGSYRRQRSSRVLRAQFFLKASLRPFEALTQTFPLAAQRIWRSFIGRRLWKRSFIQAD